MRETLWMILGFILWMRTIDIFTQGMVLQNVSIIEINLSQMYQTYCVVT